MMNFFTQFKKRKTVLKELDKLEREFQQQKIQFITVANSQLYKFFVEYFDAKIEMNRDLLEQLTSSGKDIRTLVDIQAEIRVMRDFISEIEEMKTQAEYEALDVLQP